MTKRINFFATRSDMVQLINTISDEVSFETEIVNMDNTVCGSVEDIPELGKLKVSHSEKFFLIMKKGEERVLHGTTNGVRVYLGENPRALECDPSGISQDGTSLIHGLFAITEDNEVSNELLKVARRVLKRTFTSVNGCFIGPEAMELKGKVRFVLISVNEPTEYDLNF